RLAADAFRPMDSRARPARALPGRAPPPPYADRGDRAKCPQASGHHPRPADLARRDGLSAPPGLARPEPAVLAALRPRTAAVLRRFGGAAGRAAMAQCRLRGADHLPGRAAGAHGRGITAAAVCAPMAGAP